jgi:integrase
MNQGEEGGLIMSTGRYEKTKYPGILRYLGKNEVYRIDFYASGKRHREVVEGGLSKAREELEKRRKAGRTGVYLAQATKRKYFMEDLIKKYREDKSGNSYFEKTETHYLDVIENYFKERKLLSIAPADILEFKKDREEVLKKDGSVRTNASSNREMALLRHILNYAIFPYEMIEVNPFDKFKRELSKTNLKLFREEPKRERILKPEELDKVFKNCHQYLRNVVQGLLLTGLRVRDLLNLRWDDIDWQEQVFHFTEKKKRDKKGAKPLTADFIALLKSIHRTDRDAGFIFVGHQGRPIKNPPKGFERMRIKAGITDLRMRDLRRSSATALLVNGASLPAIQEHLGHTEIAMTMKYLHMENEHLKKELDRLNGYFPQSQEFFGQKMGRKWEKESLPISEEAYNA